MKKQQRTIQSFFGVKPAGAAVTTSKAQASEMGDAVAIHEIQTGISGHQKSKEIAPAAACVDKELGAEVQLSASRRIGRRVSALRAAACLAKMDCENIPLDSKEKGREDLSYLKTITEECDASCQQRNKIQDGDVKTGPSKRRKLCRLAELVEESQLVPAQQDAPIAVSENSFSVTRKSLSERIIRSELSVSLHGDLADRFSNRDEKFAFLGKGRRDGEGRKTDHPDYDPCTLYLPPQFLKGLPAGQRQWWEIKAKHMDKVMLFKMGKFYEMFEVDAHVGAQELDLQYMRGEQPHCGFPERNYLENVRKLAQKGYRIVVVEQTETPEQLELRRRGTGAKDKVVRREICAIITKGTMTESTAVSEASYLLSITEASSLSEGFDVKEVSVLGVCAIDTTTGQFLLGQFDDDQARTRLKSILVDLRPVEVVKPNGLLSQATEQAIRDHTHNPLVNVLIPGTEFWDAKTAVQNLLSVYSDVWEERQSNRSVSMVDRMAPHGKNMQEQVQALPNVLGRLVTAGVNGEVALSAFGGCCFYLKQALLDVYLLASGQFSLLPDSGKPSHVVKPEPPNMVLDSAALEGLEILENSMDQGTSGSLMAQLDHCVTAMGRRLLRQWLLRPLTNVDAIRQRQISIRDLKGIAADGVSSFRTLLRGIPDMERLVAQIFRSRSTHATTLQKIVVYEDKSKKDVQMFIKGLRSCQLVVEALVAFESCLDELSSPRLLHLLTPGKGIPNMISNMQQFKSAFDWDDAEKTGRIMPNKGVNADFDLANSKIADVEVKFEDYLRELRKKLGLSSEISYVNVGKESYQIEIPAHLHLKVSSTFEVRSSRKGFQRYWTPRIKDLLVELGAAQEERESAMSSILGSLVSEFCSHRDNWDAVLRGIAEMDALISLSVASDCMEKPVSTPTFVSGNGVPLLRAQGLRHPTMGTGKLGGRTFVPNDVILGGQNPGFMVLTGPNMGGKSTLLRQVSIAVIMAQVGADVPAESLELSPVDQIFVRIGATDHIMAGQSTFLVELLETASMLNCATRNSLVVLDEVGRGTSTADGQAIAHAVLQHLAHKTGCRGMFSTHYHRLALDHADDPMIGLFHMACKVGLEMGGSEEVTFLYKLTSGACPRSYGVNVARLAGLPEGVLRRAVTCAYEAEIDWQVQDIAPFDEQSECTVDKEMVSHDGSKMTKYMLHILHKLTHGALSDKMILQLWESAKPLTAHLV